MGTFQGKILSVSFLHAVLDQLSKEAFMSRLLLEGLYCPGTQNRKSLLFPIVKIVGKKKNKKKKNRDVPIHLILTLFHTDRPKLHRVLASVSAIGLNCALTCFRCMTIH